MAALHLAAVQQQGQGDVLLHVQHGDEIEKLVNQTDLPPAENGQVGLVQLVDVGAVDIHLTGGGDIHAAQNVQQRGFAGTGGPDDGHKLPLLHRERYIVQCFDRCVALAVYLGQMLHTKNFHDCLPLGYPAPPDAPGLLRGCPRHAFSIRRRGDGPVTASVTVLSHDGFVKTQGEPAAPFGGALREDFAVLPG